MNQVKLNRVAAAVAAAISAAYGVGAYALSPADYAANPANVAHVYVSGATAQEQGLRELMRTAGICDSTKGDLDTYRQGSSWLHFCSAAPSLSLGGGKTRLLVLKSGDG